jgi:hypothetical protein
MNYLKKYIYIVGDDDVDNDYGDEDAVEKKVKVFRG